MYFAIQFNAISKNGRTYTVFIYHFKIRCIMQSGKIELYASNIQSDNYPIHVVMQDKNFLVQICFLCNKEMILAEGATIYGEKWYHKDCWQSIKGESKQ